MRLRDFLHFIAFQVVALEHFAIVVLAGLQDASHIDASQIYLRRRR
jgi:hypothetical protein